MLIALCHLLDTTPNDLLGVSSSSVDEREREGAESRGSSAIAAARLPTTNSAPGTLPQCARCPHRKLADKMRKMLGG